MKTSPQYFVLLVIGGTDPELRGSWDTPQGRDRAAKRIWKEQNPPYDSIFRLDVNENSYPFVHPFIQGFFGNE